MQFRKKVGPLLNKIDTTNAARYWGGKYTALIEKVNNGYQVEVEYKHKTYSCYYESVLKGCFNDRESAYQAMAETVKAHRPADDQYYAKIESKLLELSKQALEAEWMDETDQLHQEWLVFLAEAEKSRPTA